MTDYAHREFVIPWTGLQLASADDALIGKTIWLMGSIALASLPPGTEVISRDGQRVRTPIDPDIARAVPADKYFTGFGMLPRDWRAHLGSAVDRLAALEGR